jgi:HSP20 family protein
MTIVRRPSPFGELMSLRSAMDHLFEDSFVRRPFGAGFDGMNTLPMDVTSTNDAILVEAALPGIKPEDVDITVEDGTLSIRGTFKQERREDEREGETLLSEIRRGSVYRSMTLPSGVEPDKATATFEHGVLKLRIPKAEAVKPRQIRISPTTEGRPTESRRLDEVKPAGEPTKSGNGQNRQPVEQKA